VENEWQLQDAKARFSEVFRRAREQGAQRVSKHGKTAVVVIAAEEYDRLRGPRRRKQSLTAFFAQSPLVGCGLEFDRPTDAGRDIDL
jgi:prevent-host-death family protein